MSQHADWTTGPAKWVVVVILGGATLFGLGYSVGRGTTIWRVESPPQQFANVSTQSSSSSPTPPENRAPANDMAPKPAAVETVVAPTRPTDPPTSATGSIEAKININTASQAELELLPGVGPALAMRIIEERQRGGAFKRVEDLGRVRGIGPKTIEQLRKHVRVE